MTTGVLVVILLPFILIINLLIKESIALYNKLDINQLSSLISSLFKGKLESYIGSLLEKIVSYIVSVTSSIVLSLPQKILALFVLLFVLFFAFRDSKDVLHMINRSLPVSDLHKKKMAEKFKSTMDAVIYGTIAIAIVQGIFAMIGFWIFGISSPVLWGLITGVIAMLPFIGPATIWIPLSIYHYVTGHEAGAIGLGIYSLVILSLILDMLLKPKLISKKGNIHPITALLGVIGGISVFGITGIILGPFVLSLFIFFVRVLMEKK
jgi:predicted PurR-regulated permease PerM